MMEVRWDGQLDSEEMGWETVHVSREVVIRLTGTPSDDRQRGLVTSWGLLQGPHTPEQQQQSSHPGTT